MDRVMKGRDVSVMTKVKNIFSNMTVEPMIAWYILGSVVASLATQNLNLEKACRVNLNYGTEICDALERRETEKYKKQEEAVQQLVASMAIWKTLVQSLIPAILIMFLGSWSDRRRKRKPCMLLPITGEFMTAIGLILCTYFFYELPMEVAGITEAIFPAFTGGWMTMYMAVFSYIADVTSVESRTLRIGIVNLCSSLSVPIGTALSGILYKKIGYYGVFLLSAFVYVLSFGYGYYQIPEERADPENVKEALGTKCSLTRFLRDFFDLNHIKGTVSVAFKSGANNRKKRVALLMIVVVVVMGPLNGEMTVTYLFTRYRFNWNEVDFSMFATYCVITNLIGTAISVGVFSHLLKIDDALIGVMSCMSKILAGFIYAFATTTWMMYLAPIVEMANGTSFIAMRSIISKLVPPEELGKVNSVFGLVEAIVPVIYCPLYSAVYRATLDTAPGAFFLLGGALTAPAVAIFLWMYSEHKKEAQANADNASTTIIDNQVDEQCSFENALFPVEC